MALGVDFFEKVGGCRHLGAQGVDIQLLRERLEEKRRGQQDPPLLQYLQVLLVRLDLQPVAALDNTQALQRLRSTGKKNKL